MLGLTKYIASYYAGTRVRANCLTPGGVYNNHDETFTRNYAYRTIMGRMAEKDEMNGALLFLASDASAYMTGGKIVAARGRTAWAKRRHSPLSPPRGAPTGTPPSTTQQFTGTLPHPLPPESISATTAPEEALEGAAIGVLAVPAQSVRANFADWGHLVPSDIVLVSLMKGLEKGTSLRMSEVVQQSCDIPADQIAVVSGPNIAREIPAKEPAATTVARRLLTGAPTRKRRSDNEMPPPINMISAPIQMKRTSGLKYALTA